VRETVSGDTLNLIMPALEIVEHAQFPLQESVYERVKPLRADLVTTDVKVSDSRMRD